MCVQCLCRQPGSFGTSAGQVCGKWEQYHNDQRNIWQVYWTKYSCQGNNFEDSLTCTRWSLACNMKLMPYLSNTTVDGTLYKIHIRCCSYYKDEAHCSRYALAQGIELEGFVRINDTAEMSFVVLT